MDAYSAIGASALLRDAKRHRRSCNTHEDAHKTKKRSAVHLSPLSQSAPELHLLLLRRDPTRVSSEAIARRSDPTWRDILQPTERVIVDCVLYRRAPLTAEESSGASVELEGPSHDASVLDHPDPSVQPELILRVDDLAVDAFTEIDLATESLSDEDLDVDV